jgi:hypothetical protein
MGSYGQNRRSSYTSPPNYGYPNIGNGQQSPHLHGGSNNIGLDRNIIDPSLQHYNPQYPHQLAIQSVGGISSIDPAVLEGYPSQTWPQQHESTGQELWYDQRDLTPATVRDPSNGQANVSGTPIEWQANQRHPLEQGGVSMPMMSNRSGNRRTSRATFNDGTGSYVQNIEYPQQADPIIGSQTFQNTRLASHDPHLLDLRQVNTTSFNANSQQQPWSVYGPAYVYQQPYTFEGATEPHLQGAPDMTLPTTDYTTENMDNSVSTERPAATYPPFTQYDTSLPCSPSLYHHHFQIDIERFATPLGTQSTTQDSSQWESGSLSVPLERSRSARSSVSDASSTGPPTFTPEILYCDVGVCRRTFSGLYRRGNLGRHKRQKHAEGTILYVCHDNTCAKEFKRKDARLKHYRKYHPELAVASPLVRRSRSGCRTQEVELSNMSSWAG